MKGSWIDEFEFELEMLDISSAVTLPATASFVGDDEGGAVVDEPCPPSPIAIPVPSSLSVSSSAGAVVGDKVAVVDGLLSAPMPMAVPSIPLS